MADDTKQCSTCEALCFRVHLNAGECVPCARKTTRVINTKVAELEKKHSWCPMCNPGETPTPEAGEQHVDAAWSLPGESDTAEQSAKVDIDYDKHPATYTAEQREGSVETKTEGG